AFMGLTYYVVPLVFQKEFFAKSWVRVQPWLFGIGITIFSIFMSFAGSYGVPRRHWDTEFSGAQFAVGFDPGAYVMLGIMGLAAILAFLALFLFIGLVVATVFFGRSNAGGAMEAWHTEKVVRTFQDEPRVVEGAHRTPGTMVLALVFLASFAVYYFANWMWLADVWQVR
ncbi:MAG: cbb3-type cytochrome c oxidase subunit I, partial [Deltaproteobacteria bacterium]